MVSGGRKSSLLRRVLNVEVFFRIVEIKHHNIMVLVALSPHLFTVAVSIWVCNGQYEPVKSPKHLSVSSIFQQILTRKYYNLSDEQQVQSVELK